MLFLKSIHTYYGSIHALRGVSLHVEEGEIVTLIGANGTGKTTLLKTICGLLRPQKGSIHFLGEEITGLPSESIVRKGISLVPEGRMVFSSLSVHTNLEMGAFCRRKARSQIQKEINSLQQQFPILNERMEQLAGTLSGGEQQILAICRALMSKPRLLILDEPSMGLAPILTREIFGIILGLRNEGRTILLVEQNARSALQIADRGYVLETGRIILEGKSKTLLNHKEVQRAYLGKGYKEVWED